jgi:hypothetical protein
MLKIYDEYQKYGVQNYYLKHSKEYYNPHEDKISELYQKHLTKIISNNDIILDIACGNGLISKLAIKYNNNNNTIGIDPYFQNDCTHYNLSFEDIAKGELNKINKKYDIAICSYAFHLINNDYKYDFLTELSLQTSKFIIITPSKKINIKHPLWIITNEIREDKITIIFLEYIYN